MAQQPIEASIKTIGQQNPNVAYIDRRAVRVILYNPITKHIALIHVVKGNYYKLPGGGIDDGEDHAVAVAREVMEETGCMVSMDSKEYFARSEEWRNDLHQISFCYTARMVEDTGKPDLTELETFEGLSHRWVLAESAVKMMQEI